MRNEKRTLHLENKIRPETESLTPNQYLFKQSSVTKTIISNRGDVILPCKNKTMKKRLKVLMNY